MSGAGGRLQTYAAENKKSEELISNRINYETENEDCSLQYHKLDCVAAQSQPPLPVNIFGIEFKRALDEKYNNSVYGTGKRVTQRLLSYYIKPKKDFQSQTDSEDILTQGYI